MVIKGVFKNVKVDKSNLYTMFTIQNETSFTFCNGILPEILDFTIVEVEGELIDKGGRKILQNCKVREERNPQNLKTLLMSVKGIGEKTADELLTKVDTSTFFDDVLSTQGFYFLRKYSSENISNEIIKVFKENKAKYEILDFCNEYGLSLSTALKICKKTNCNVEDLKKNLYSLAKKCDIPFDIMDNIACKVGFPNTNKDRIVFGCIDILKKATMKGHTFLDYEELLTETQEMLNSNAYAKDLSKPMINSGLSNTKVFTKKEDKVFLKELFINETMTAKNLKRLIETRQTAELDTEEMCEYAENLCGVKYADAQREAFGLLNLGGPCIITGGPGTGKTTVIKGLIEGYQKMYPTNKITLCSPTGRAAQRMTEATGRPATTIHKLLEYKPFGDTFICKNENDQIDTDFLFVDEVSMVSIDVMDLLCRAIKSGTMVIFAGDIYQLSSVGAGNVLKDMIASNAIPVVQLIKTYRQKAGSYIISNANAINSGDKNLSVGTDFEIRYVKNDDELCNFAIEEYEKYHDNKKPFAVEILAPARRTFKTGVNDLNQAIQKKINDVSGVKHGRFTFCVGDKVMMLRNNYAKNYYNGDVGIISRINNESCMIKIDKDFLEIDSENYEDMTLAYGTTIHKSQGSEYDVGIVVMPKTPKIMLLRNLFYTAVTRGKKKVIVIGYKDSIDRSIVTNTSQSRNTILVDLLKNDKQKQD